MSSIWGSIYSYEFEYGKAARVTLRGDNTISGKEIRIVSNIPLNKPGIFLLERAVPQYYCGETPVVLAEEVDLAGFDCFLDDERERALVGRRIALTLRYSGMVPEGCEVGGKKTVSIHVIGVG